MTCLESEHLLMQLQIEALPVETLTRLEHHLHSCSNCRALSSTFTKIKHSLGKDQNSLPKPSPQILPELLRTLNRIDTGNPRTSDIIYRMRTFFTRPVPLYQAAIAVCFVLMVSVGSFLADRLYDPSSTGQISGLSPDVQNQFQKIYIFEYQHREEPSCGFNAVEDTAFSDISFISM